MNAENHLPVLLNETLEFLCPKNGEIFVDGTLGAGGHAIEILKRIAPDGKLIGIDQDKEAIKIAKKILSQFETQLIIKKENFSNMQRCLKKLNIDKVDGILLDLGMSSMQVDDPERGFSFRNNGTLDMRMDKDSAISAYDIINDYSEKDLADIIFTFGEERKSRRIARAIVSARPRQKIMDTATLEDIIFKAAGPYKYKPKTHPATRTFQALRLVVNNELTSLQKLLESVMSVLKNNARVCIISYHSLEDRIVKHGFRNLSRLGMGKVLTKKPVCPAEMEVKMNNRARSAKLRAFMTGEGICTG